MRDLIATTFVFAVMLGLSACEEHGPPSLTSPTPVQAPATGTWRGLTVAAENENASRIPAFGSVRVFGQDGLALATVSESPAYCSERQG